MEIDEQMEQRLNIKFLVKLGKNSQEIHEMLRAAYGDNALKKTALFKCIKRFSEDREDCKDDARPDDRRPPVLMKTSNMCGLLCFPIAESLSG